MNLSHHVYYREDCSEAEAEEINAALSINTLAPRKVQQIEPPPVVVLSDGSRWTGSPLNSFPHSNAVRGRTEAARKPDLLKKMRTTIGKL